MKVMADGALRGPHAPWAGLDNGRSLLLALRSPSFLPLLSMLRSEGPCQRPLGPVSFWSHTLSSLLLRE